MASVAKPAARVARTKRQRGEDPADDVYAEGVDGEGEEGPGGEGGLDMYAGDDQGYMGAPWRSTPADREARVERGRSDVADEPALKRHTGGARVGGSGRHGRVVQVDTEAGIIVDGVSDSRLCVLLCGILPCHSSESAWFPHLKLSFDDYSSSAFEFDLRR